MRLRIETLNYYSLKNNVHYFERTKSKRNETENWFLEVIGCISLKFLHFDNLRCTKLEILRIPAAKRDFRKRN